MTTSGCHDPWRGVLPRGRLVSPFTKQNSTFTSQEQNLTCFIWICVLITFDYLAIFAINRYFENILSEWNRLFVAFILVVNSLSPAIASHIHRVEACRSITGRWRMPARCLWEFENKWGFTRSANLLSANSTINWGADSTACIAAICASNTHVAPTLYISGWLCWFPFQGAKSAGILVCIHRHAGNKQKSDETEEAKHDGCG